MKIRKALLSVSDKTDITLLGKALAQAGAELIATGKTAKVLEEAGLTITPIEKVSGSPEAFQGRMKTLSFPVCSGILYRRGNEKDEGDLKKLNITPIDCVVVNFYPFEEAIEGARKKGEVKRDELIEQIDIGGPTLVRSAAKNSPDTLVVTDPSQYSEIIEELESNGKVSKELALKCSARAWDRVEEYDRSIASEFGEKKTKTLRYGENPHQRARLVYDEDSPLAWDEALTTQELSYNNILDLTAAYSLAVELKALNPQATGVVVVKHNNPCGVALIPHGVENAQKLALKRAWDGDPVSAFGGVLVFTDPIGEECAQWLAERFVEVVAAPELTLKSSALEILTEKRKKLKAVRVRRFGDLPKTQTVDVPGGKLFQSSDLGMNETLESVTKTAFPAQREDLARFGIAVCRALKSNSIALVREIQTLEGAFQLVGAGQGQPNRVEALKALAVPRAQKVLNDSEGTLSDCILISDAFFPFRDTVDVAAGAGVTAIIQPGGSIKDKDSIAACNELGIAMAFTGVRHFRH